MQTEMLEEKTELINSIEEKKEELTARFGLTDEEFNLLIRNVILDSFDKLRIRLSADDPIFAVVLAQKNVMDYYSVMITNSLNNIPKQIGNAIDGSLNDFSEKIALIGEAFDNELKQFKNEFSSQTLELNNQIISSFNSFIDKKIDEAKETLNITSNNHYSTVQLSKNQKIFNTILISINLVLLVVMLAMFYSNNVNNKSNEIAYQIGLYKGFETIKKEFDPKNSKKIETIIIESIDNELRNKN